MGTQAAIGNPFNDKYYSQNMDPNADSYTAAAQVAADQGSKITARAPQYGVVDVNSQAGLAGIYNSISNQNSTTNANINAATQLGFVGNPNPGAPDPGTPDPGTPNPAQAPGPTSVALGDPAPSDPAPAPAPAPDPNEDPNSDPDPSDNGPGDDGTGTGTGDGTGTGTGTGTGDGTGNGTGGGGGGGGGGGSEKRGGFIKAANHLVEHALRHVRSQRRAFGGKTSVVNKALSIANQPVSKVKHSR
jgi:hypothetical protein